MRVVLYGEIVKRRGHNDPYWYFKDNNMKKMLVLNKFETTSYLTEVIQKSVYSELLNNMYENIDTNNNNYNIGLGYGNKENDTYNVILKLDLPDDLIFERSFKRDKNGPKRLTLGALEEDRQMIIVEDADAVENDRDLLSELEGWIREDNAAQIQSVLCRVWIDFRTYISNISNSGDGEEIIKQLRRSIDYSNGRIPAEADYSDQYVQQIYTLVFGYMYMFNYYTIYKKLLEMNNTPFAAEGLKVLSFGCGAKWDGMGMKMAIESVASNSEYSYRGIDYAGWNAHGYDFRINDGDFCLQGVLEFLDALVEHDTLKENVFFFPTSISEFDRINNDGEGNNDGRTTLDKMLDRMIPHIVSEHIYFATSVRYNETDNEAQDIDSMIKIKERFEEDGWSCVSEIKNVIVGVEDGTEDERTEAERIKAERAEVEREYNKLFCPGLLKDKINKWLKENIDYNMMTDRKHANFYIMEFRR